MNDDHAVSATHRNDFIVVASRGFFSPTFAVLFLRNRVFSFLFRLLLAHARIAPTNLLYILDEEGDLWSVDMVLVTHSRMWASPFHSNECLN